MAFAPIFALVLSIAARAAEPAVPPPPSPDPDPAAAAAAKEDFPPGAPTDDYGFVSWCYGALRGHMDLYQLVKPQLDQLATSDAERKKNAIDDAQQMKAGEDYLALYQRAMTAAEKASVRPINAQGADAVQMGHSIWNPASVADPKTRMWSWLLWELPGRCETTALRLERRAGLLGSALRTQESTPAPAEAAPPPEAVPPAPPPEPAPPPPPEPVAAPKDEVPADSAPPPPPPDAAPPADAPPAPDASAAPPPEPAPPKHKSGSFVVDPDNPQPCPGTLEPTKKGGKSVLVCRM